MGTRCSHSSTGRVRPIKFLIICLLLLGLALAILLPGATAAALEEAALVQNVHSECGFTRYPSVCSDTLLAGQALGVVVHAADMVALLVEKTKEETILSTDKLKTPDFPLGESQSPKIREVIGYCDELMQKSVKRLDQSLNALKTSAKASKPDIQTWLSAVVTFQDACRDSAAESPGPLVSQVAARMDRLSALASNALALANRIPGGAASLPDSDPAAPSRHLSESSSKFPDWVSEEDRRLLESSEVSAHAVVAQDGTGDYLTIPEALDAVRTSLVGGRQVIFIKAGVYKQKFSVSNDNVMLVGAGKDTTLITNSASVGGGASMPGTATVVVDGDNFIAKDIGFENAAGADNHQAIALRISSDHAVLYHCSIRGHQDTLYAVALRQFYRECDIYGSIDYIFGNAAAVFQSCNLIFQRPHSKGINTVTASGRSDPGQNTGFVIQGCRIAAGSELAPVKSSVRSYLGRPWKQYARVVVMQSSIDDSLQPSGWAPWAKGSGFALSTLYFGEYGNSGAGAATGGRVSWGGFHLMGAGEASKFTVSNFIYGNSWLPGTGVTFNPGL